MEKVKKSVIPDGQGEEEFQAINEFSQSKIQRKQPDFD